MEKIGLVLDSTVYLEKEMLDRPHVKVVSLHVLEGENSYKETDITPEFVIEQIGKGRKVSTAQPSPEAFKNAFEAFFNEGYDKVATIVISSGLSGTYQSAKLGQDLLESRSEDVHVFDTLNAGFGNELIAERALEMIEAGVDFQSLIETIDTIASKAGLLFTVENLFHLQRGGRLSRRNALIGTVLRIKPIIRLNEKGELKPVHKERTVGKLIAYVVKTIKSTVDEKAKLNIRIVHQRSEEQINRLIEALKKAFDNPTIKVTDYIGP
ncbi:MAG: DegV family protein, partial [Candidatus Izemoplasmataceae bacterium]